MPLAHLVVLVLALLAAARPGDAESPAACMRASGNADARCLDRYAEIVARCRAQRDTGCEAAARAAGGVLEDVLARPEDPSRDACTDAASEPLDYSGADDVVLRGQEACADFAEDWLAAVFTQQPSSLSGAFLDCQREVSRQLGRLRRATVRLHGERCFLPAYRGDACNRTRRDRLLAELGARVRRRISGRCGARFDTLGLGALDDVIARVGTSARHFAQLVYPPNDLGPMADFGPHLVGVRTLTLVDQSRLDARGMGPRPVTVEVYYPSTEAAIASVPRDLVTVLGVPIVRTRSYRDVALAPGLWPLVLFSHGNGGIRFQSFFFAAHLASHGYVVASPDHHGNTFVDLLQGIPADALAFSNRPLDMSFLIDRFLAFNAEPGNVFAGAIDPVRIGASGHSFGGYTVFTLAGGPSAFGTFTDARVKAILPQAPGSPFPPGFFATITIPTLIVGGSIDETTAFESQQRAPWDALPPGAPVVGLAELAGAGHFTFSDFCEVPRDLLDFLGGFDEACEPRHLPWRRAHDIINYLSLAFFDAVLKDDAAALARLDPAAVATIEDLRFNRK